MIEWTIKYGKCFVVNLGGTAGEFTALVPFLEGGLWTGAFFSVLNAYQEKRMEVGR